MSVGVRQETPTLGDLKRLVTRLAAFMVEAFNEDEAHGLLEAMRGIRGTVLYEKPASIDSFLLLSGNTVAVAEGDMLLRGFEFRDRAVIPLIVGRGIDVARELQRLAPLRDGPGETVSRIDYILSSVAAILGSEEARAMLMEGKYRTTGSARRGAGLLNELTVLAELSRPSAPLFVRPYMVELEYFWTAYLLLHPLVREPCLFRTYAAFDPRDGQVKPFVETAVYTGRGKRSLSLEALEALSKSEVLRVYRLLAPRVSLFVEKYRPRIAKTWFALKTLLASEYPN